MHGRLYVRGVIPKGGVAIVGSRTPPADAIEFAYRLASRIKTPVISGLAPGIDAAAHRGALAAGIPTVAFVGYGFGRTDPPEHEELERAILEAGGAIATLSAPGTPATEGSRIERDRLQVEHSQAVVLVCTELSGGAMHTMRFARELGVGRFAATPPNDAVDSEDWAGNLKAIADGATALPLNLDEALVMLGAALRRTPEVTQRAPG